MAGKRRDLRRLDGNRKATPIGHRFLLDSLTGMAPTRTLRMRFDGFELDELDARLWRGGVPVHMPPRAFAVLCMLARQPRQLVTKDELLDAVWGHRHVSESVLKTTISELRAALTDDARQPRYIETASRRGYRFIANVAEASLGSKLQEPDSIQFDDQREMGTVPCIGREAALAELHSAWERAKNGERQLVWIAGEAGVGKTRLIERFVQEIGADVATFGQCVEDFGTGEPYLPILEAVRELCRRDPALIDGMRSVAPTWLVQMPWLVSDADRAGLFKDVEGAHQDRMVREMRELMDRFTAKRPLVFVLEDLHWSDAGTLRMMDHFARRPREVRLMWIASFRLTQVLATDHPLRALRQELKLHNLCREIVLDPFTEQEVATFLGDRMPGVPLSEAFVRRIHGHTDGLPLFVATVADNLLAQAGGDATALRELAQSTRGVSLPVPDSLAGVIEKQIGLLDADVQSLLEAASVIGVEFRASAVAALLKRDIDWVCDRCDELVKRQFWVRLSDIDELPDGGIDPRYAFLHVLYKHVFYDRMPRPRRVLLHREVLRDLEAVRVTGRQVAATEMASHAERAHLFAPALGYYAEAADRAVASYVPSEALSLTSTGLALLPRVTDEDERMRLELGLVHRRGVAAAQLLGVGSKEAVSAFERTLELCNVLRPTPERALLLSGLGLTRYVCADYQSAELLARRVLVIGEQHEDDIVRVSGAAVLGNVQAARAEHAASCATFESGIAACARIKTIPPGLFIVDPQASMHSNIAIPLMSMGRADEARRHIQMAQARARDIGQPTARMLSLWAEGMLYVRAQDPARVRACALEIQRVVEKSMLMQGMGPAKWLLGWAMAHEGNPREGHALIREGYEMHAKLGMYAGNTETLGYAAMALVLAQDWAAAARQIDEALELADRIHEHVMTPYLLRLRAHVTIAQGDGDRARAILQQALEAARAQAAPFDELKCLFLINKYGLGGNDELATLRGLYDQLVEGRDLPFMKKVAELLPH